MKTSGVTESVTPLVFCVAKLYYESRNFVRLGAPSKLGDGVVTYDEPTCIEEQRRITEFMPSKSTRAEIDARQGAKK